jgi:hypothetical protein
VHRSATLVEQPGTVAGHKQIEITGQELVIRCAERIRLVHQASVATPSLRLG